MGGQGEGGWPTVLALGFAPAFVLLTHCGCKQRVRPRWCNAPPLRGKFHPVVAVRGIAFSLPSCAKDQLEFQRAGKFLRDGAATCMSTTWLSIRNGRDVVISAAPSAQKKASTPTTKPQHPMEAPRRAAMLSTAIARARTTRCSSRLLRGTARSRVPTGPRPGRKLGHVGFARLVPG